MDPAEVAGLPAAEEAGRDDEVSEALVPVKGPLQLPWVADEDESVSSGDELFSKDLDWSFLDDDKVL